jgi:hypothetical protein
MPHALEQVVLHVLDAVMR